MLMLERHSKESVCQVCGQYAANRANMGLESERGTASYIHLCDNCGPIDLEIMQLCREVAIHCSDN
jgi:hypothetical protein